MRFSIKIVKTCIQELKWLNFIHKGLSFQVFGQADHVINSASERPILSPKCQGNKSYLQEEENKLLIFTQAYTFLSTLCLCQTFKYEPTRQIFYELKEIWFTVRIFFKEVLISITLLIPIYSISPPSICVP